MIENSLQAIIVDTDLTRWGPEFRSPEDQSDFNLLHMEFGEPINEILCETAKKAALCIYDARIPKPEEPFDRDDTILSSRNNSHTPSRSRKNK